MTRTRYCDTEPAHPCDGQSSETYACQNTPCVISKSNYLFVLFSIYDK